MTKHQQVRSIKTRNAILRAATKAFVQKGYAGASTLQIASAAQVNHSLVFHHFKNKENLWLAVKADIVQKAEKKSMILPDKELPWPEFLEALIAKMYTFYYHNTDIARMLSWQRMEKMKTKDIGVTKSAMSQVWLDCFKHYQQLGAINANFPPEFVMTMILSLVSSAALDPNIYLKQKETMQDYLTFCKQAVLRALA